MSCSGLGVTGHPQGRDELYRFFFDWNPQPMWVWDLHTLHFLAANGGAIRHYGYFWSRMTPVWGPTRRAVHIFITC